MKHIGRALALILSFILLLCACTVQKEDTPSETDTSSTAQSGVYAEDADMFSARDYEIGYDESNSIQIKLNGDSVSCDSDSVAISDTTVTIRDEGTYILSGTLRNGRIVVDAEKTDKPQLVLNGASIHCETSAPLYVAQADKVFVTLPKDSKNTLSNGGTFTAVDENNIDAVIFSKEDLTLNGEGSLTVTSPAGHGIVSKDDLVCTGGNYTVKAASHALDANDSVRLKNAAFTLDAGKDGIHAEITEDTDLGFVYIASGTLHVTADGDGISAGAYMQIKGGSFSVESGGGSDAAVKKQTTDPRTGSVGRPDRFGNSAASDAATTDTSDVSGKALKATGNLQIRDGSFTLNAADDAVHANASITVDGGTFQIATGDDGFHADETLTVQAGTVEITESYEGLEALNLNIQGGDIRLTADDDGLNAAGGKDESGFGGPRGNAQPDRGGMDTFGPGGKGGAGGSASNGTICISGGTLQITASGDGIDANGSVTISGGNITVCGPMQGDTATLDFDVSGTITGGTFIGTGAAGMAQTFSASEQGVLAVNVGSQSAGTQIKLQDKSGKTLLSHTPQLPYTVVILSTPDLKSGETYTLSVGSSSADFQAS